ncbi:MAG: LytTR family DNA-binding domain-containing protein [Fusobacteriota bacterium]
MDISLICKKGMKKGIEQILISKGFSIEEKAEIALVEKGMEDELDRNTFICFDSKDLNSLMSFLDILDNQNDELKDFIAAKKDEKFELFPLDKIQFFEADNNYVYCVIEGDKKPYRVKEKLYELEEKLDSKKFRRVSKSNIVNVINIKQIVPWFSSKLLLKFKGSKRNIEVTRSYAKKFKDYLGM